MKQGRRRRADGSIRLKKAYRERLEALLRGNEVTARVRARARILLLSDKMWDRASITEATGASGSTVGRVRRRYVDEGLKSALGERPRPGARPKLSERQTQQIIAVVCTDPPEGFARWSVRLLTAEIHRRGLVDSPVSRERIRLVLRDHDLKPWREKNVVRSEAYG